MFHEEDNIIELIKHIDKFVHEPFELIVVYDMLEDPTYQVVKDFIAENRREDILLLQNNVGSGRGPANAIISGLRAASSHAILVVMADLSDDLAQVDEMVYQYCNGATIVCASRYMAGGKKVGGPPLKKLLAKVAGVSLHYLRGIPTHDITHNYNIYDKAFIDSIDIESTDGFEVAMEIKVKAFLAKKRIVEIPTAWYERTSGKSKFKMKWVPLYFKWYMYALTNGRYGT